MRYTRFRVVGQWHDVYPSGRPVFYSPPRVPMDCSWTAHSPHGVLMDSSWSLHGLLMDCSWSHCGVLMESSWNAHGVCGVLMESMEYLWTP
jgi:hypothetical protein